MDDAFNVHLICVKAGCDAWTMIYPDESTSDFILVRHGQNPEHVLKIGYDQDFRETLDGWVQRIHPEPECGGE